MAMEPQERDISLENEKQVPNTNVPRWEESIWSKGSYVPRPSTPLEQQPSHENSLPVKRTPFKRQHTPKGPFRLLELPPELRNAIYHAMLHRFTKKTAFPRHAQHITSVLSQSPKPLTALLQTCKQIRHELLPVLFDVFLWTIDIRYHEEHPGTFIVVPASAWLNHANTLSHPIDGTIRRVKLRFKFRVPRSAADRAVAKQNVQVAQIARCVVWSLQIALLPREPFWAVTDVRARAHSKALWWELHHARSKVVAKTLCAAAAEVLGRIVERKRSGGEGVSGFSGMEWREVVDALDGAFLEWFLGDEFSRQRDFRFIIGVS